MARSATLSKTAFVQKVAARAKRYSATFGVGRLDEWIKQGLAFKADRRPSRGRRRTFVYGCRHYRRALQLVRLYGLGVRDRDALLLQLFICGYSVEPHDVRDSLKKEFGKAIAKINSSIRSTYADSRRTIPLGRRQQLRRQLGQVDDRLQKAGMYPPEDFIISVLRAARDPNRQALNPNGCNEFIKVVYDIVNFVFSGVLAQNGKTDSVVGKIIMHGSARQYQQARLAFQCGRKLFGIISSGNQRHLADSCGAIYDSLVTREFSAVFLALMLKLVADEFS